MRLWDKVSYVDIDRDGQFETIIGLACYQPNGGESTNHGIKAVSLPFGLSDGTVQVWVENVGLCCDMPYTSAQHQLRTYSWDGQKFAQSAGSTEFHPASTDTDIAVTATDLVFGKPSDGKRTGKVTYTVTNASARAVEDVALFLRLDGASTSGGGWALRPGSDQAAALVRRVGALAAGQSIQVEITVTTTQTNTLAVGVSVMGIPSKANGDELRDLNPANDSEGTEGIAAPVKFS